MTSELVSEFKLSSFVACSHKVTDDNRQTRMKYILAKLLTNVGILKVHTVT